MKDTIIVIRKLIETEATSSAKGVERLAGPLSGARRTEYDHRRNYQEVAGRKRPPIPENVLLQRTQSASRERISLRKRSGNQRCSV